MIPINRTYAPVQVLVDELARCGVRHAVTSPGSRNAPLLLVLAADDRITCLSVLDERSAGFAALGMAKATDEPVIVTCTSGTAAANLMPAVAEAWEARVPLIVLTADRPPELRDVGAGQAIDQIKLYGAQVKWFVEVGNHEPGRDSALHHRSLACRAVATALGGRPGPVHLNLPLREPLAPAREELDPEPWQGRPDGRPWVRVNEPTPRAEAEWVRALAREVGTTARGAVVCGSTGEDLGASVAALAARLGWPVLAEPTSGVRCGPHDRSAVVAHYDALLRSPEWAAAHQADLVLRLGDTPTSKPLRSWLAEARQVVIDPTESWHEPTREAEWVLRVAAAPLCRALVEELEPPGSEPRSPDPEWLAGWRAADAAVAPALAAAADPSEPGVHATLEEALADGDVLWVASSMAIRDVETFLPSSPKGIRILSNRGANGIDGTVSSALGAAVASGRRVVLATGELALLHDLGGLLAARRHGVDLTIVCLNNGGGGIFDFLPVATVAEAAAYVEQVIAPSGADLEHVAALAGIPHRRADSAAEVAALLRGGPCLVEVRTDRATNVAVHREIFARVGEALGSVR